MSESETEEAQLAAPMDDVEDDRPFPIEGKFRSLKDKAEIMALPEARREQILSERLDAEDSPRKLTRQKTKATENLEAYKRQREQRNEQRRRDGDRRERSKLSPSEDREGSEADAGVEDDNDVDWDDKPARSSSPGHQEGPLVLENIRMIKVGRTAFAKHCFTPGFDDAIKGVFVRLAVGILDNAGQRDYRMGTVKGESFIHLRNFIVFADDINRGNHWKAVLHGRLQQTAIPDGPIYGGRTSKRTKALSIYAGLGWSIYRCMSFYVFQVRHLLTLFVA